MPTIWDAVSRALPTTAMLSTVGGLFVLGGERRRAPQEEGHGGDDGEETLHPHSVEVGAPAPSGAGAGRA